jgi:hypothetical protein
LMIKSHGKYAELESARRADKFAKIGDENGVAVWRGVTRAVAALTNTTPPARCTNAVAIWRPRAGFWRGFAPVLAAATRVETRGFQPIWTIRSAQADLIGEVLARLGVISLKCLEVFLPDSRLRSQQFPRRRTLKTGAMDWHGWQAARNARDPSQPATGSSAAKDRATAPYRNNRDAHIPKSRGRTRRT